MSSIRGSGSSAPPPPEPSLTRATTLPSRPSGLTGPAAGLRAPVDTNERVGVSATPGFLQVTGIEPPAPPRVALLGEANSGAASFAGQLMEMGHHNPKATSEAMLLTFLKLQVMETGRGSSTEQMCNVARSTLYGVALGEQKGLVERNAVAASLQAQADQAEGEAASEKEQADQIAQKGGVKTQELEQDFDQSVAEGKGGTDVFARYEAAHKDDPDWPDQKAALLEAQPHYERAGQAFGRADDLGTEAGNKGGLGIMGTYATCSQRAGTGGMQALLANEAAQKQLNNELVAILAGQRPDAKARDEGVRDLDASRLEVAKSILSMIDQHAMLQMGHLQPMRS